MPRLVHGPLGPRARVFAPVPRRALHGCVLSPPAAFVLVDIFAHTGGAIAYRLASANPSAYTGVVLSAPMLGIDESEANDPSTLIHHSLLSCF
jgi:hypothetical protein